VRKVFLDVRSPAEFAIDGLPNSINVPHDTLLNNLQSLPKDAEILVYCRSGRRSNIVVKVMSMLGYNVTDVETVFNATIVYEKSNI
jgi:phage shock protein E